LDPGQLLIFNVTASVGDGVLPSSLSLISILSHVLSDVNICGYSKSVIISSNVMVLPFLNTILIVIGKSAPNVAPPL
jgi:hypothetical protein